MKRIGNLLDEILQPNNLSDAFDFILRTKKRRKTRRGKYLMKHREETIQWIERTIREQAFRITYVHEFQVHEHGKTRNIHSITLRNRMLLNAVMSVVEEHITKTFIRETASSIKGRGMHYLHEHFRDNMLADPDGTRYSYKCDIHHFYESIPQDKMWEVTKRYIKDRYVLAILEKCIFFLPEGLSIGLRSSQILANLYLSHYADHVMKDVIGVRYYYRYCDDILIQASNKHELTYYVTELKRCIDDAGLEIKNNETFFETSKQPVDFLGYKTYTDGKVLLRKHIKQNFARKWKKVKSMKRKVSLIGSFYGIAKHADARHLFKRLTDIDMTTFAELGLSYKDPNGKSYFDVEYIALSEVVNTKITLLDVIPDITTKNGTRHVFKFSRDGEELKSMTSNNELKYYLEQMKERNLFPVETTLLRKKIGNGKYKYQFT